MEEAEEAEPNREKEPSEKNLIFFLSDKMLLSKFQKFKKKLK